MSRDKGKPLPVLRSDEEAEEWLATADLSEYDLSTMRPFSSEFRIKDARVNMRMPHDLLTQLKAASEEEGIPYQRLMRDLLEKGLAARGAQTVPKKKAS
jgi:predicted DNA binding CopG/RHH family protein